MPQETETVNGNPEAQQNEENGKDDATVPMVQEDACILKPNVQPVEEAACSLKPAGGTPKSPVAEATEDFLLNEKGAYANNPEPNIEAQPVPTSPQPVIDESPVAVPEPAPRTPANSEASENGISPPPSEEQQPPVSIPPQIVEVSVYTETVVVENHEPTLNGNNSSTNEVVLEEPHQAVPEPVTNGECKWEPKSVMADVHVEPVETEAVQQNGKSLNGTIASELIAEDYKLPDVVEVKKNFEYVQPKGLNVGAAPPKRGALSTALDSRSVSQAYQDVRFDGSETQWAVFKFEGPTIVTSATGTDFAQFKSLFGDDERAFGYIRVSTGDEMSKRAKFLFVTWVGPSVSVLKRAKMSTDKALIKDIVSNFAVELQTENISDINLQNFESELDKAAGAHYGTGIRS